MNGVTCAYDTGSMYGCEPACSRPATLSFTYDGRYTLPLCKAHEGPMRGRAYPYTVEVSPL